MSADSIDFGAVALDSAATDHFSLRNAGDSSLRGTLHLACEGFDLVSDSSTATSGDSSYNLPAGGFQVFAVRFAPARVADFLCTLPVAGVAGGIRLHGQGVPRAGPPGPECTVSASSLDFGRVPVGGSSTLNFTARNSGSGVLTANLVSSCPDYVASPTHLELASGDSALVSVRFQPQAAESAACSVTLSGSACSLTLLGVGFLHLPAGSCQLSPGTLDFGPVPVGDSLDRSFEVRNVAGLPIAFNVTAACLDFRVVGPSGFTLSSGESLSVAIRFIAHVPGRSNCTLSLGSESCPTLTCTGAGLSPQAGCGLSADSLDFGTVTLGDTASRSFTITNPGQALLTGTAVTSCADFAISGSAAFSVAPRQSQPITVLFRPNVAGLQVCSVNLNSTACSPVKLVGRGAAPPPVSACVLGPEPLDFGVVEVGKFAERILGVKNNGSQAIAFNFQNPCADVSIVNSTNFALAHGESLGVRIRFAPSNAGPLNCQLATGNASCPTVTCVGSGIAGGPVCVLSADTLNFGTVYAGDSLELALQLSNPGGLPLTGNAVPSCPEYLVVGSGYFNVAPGSTAQLNVRFRPTLVGARRCSLRLNSGGCDSVALLGTGITPPPLNCFVQVLIAGSSSQDVSFGIVTVGDTDSAFVQITNSSLRAYSDTLIVSAPSFEVRPDHFSFTPTGSRVFRIRFHPGFEGTYSGTIRSQNSACVSILLDGFATPPLAPGALSWASQGTGVGQFTGVGGLAVDATGNVYLTDPQQNRVEKFTAAGVFRAGWGEYGQYEGQFRNPAGVAVDTAGNVYVADRDNSRVQVFSSSGEFLRSFGSRLGPDSLHAPVSIAVDPEGNAWVLDLAAYHVIEYSPSGVFLKLLGGPCGASGCGLSTWQAPVGVAVDRAGLVYVLDSFHESSLGGLIPLNRVIVYEQNGAPLRSFGSFGSGTGQFVSGAGLAVSVAGFVYVTDGACCYSLGGHSDTDNRVVKFSTLGVPQGWWGGTGTGLGQFTAPGAIATGPDGRVFVADGARIDVFSASQRPGLKATIARRNLR